MRSTRELGLGAMPPRRGGDFDWDAVDAELQGVSAGFKDPKFDPIAHVLNLLSSGDADHQLAKVVFIWWWPGRGVLLRPGMWRAGNMHACRSSS